MIATGNYITTALKGRNAKGETIALHLGRHHLVLDGMKVKDVAAVHVDGQVFVRVADPKLEACLRLEARSGKPAWDVRDAQEDALRRSAGVVEIS